MASGQFPFTVQELKRAAYGMSRPSLEVQKQRGVAAASRLVADLPMLAKHFPNGFGSLFRELRSWLAE
jgi:hypothetical protein